MNLSYQWVQCAISTEEQLMKTAAEDMVEGPQHKPAVPRNADHRRPPTSRVNQPLNTRPEVLSFGTSLMAGLSQHMRNEGINNFSYAYSSAQIPDIGNRFDGALSS